MVAFCAPAGIGPGGAKEREVDVVKGRRRRVRKVGMLFIVRRKRRGTRRRASRFSLLVGLKCAE